VKEVVIMADAVQAAIVAGVLSATVTACVTYLSTVTKIRKDLEAATTEISVTNG
jgi:hypothetical protein